MRKSLFALLLFIVSFAVCAQNINPRTPLNVQSAIEKQTRTKFGVPGEKYWINHANYTINVNFDPGKSLLKGSASIIYYNESPDFLEKIVFNIPQNLYKMGNARDWDMGNTDVHNGVDIKSLEIGGKVIEKGGSGYYETGTKLITGLQKTLYPSDSIVIKINWEEKIAEEVSIRSGKYNDSSFFIAYWYPQIAVYDDVDGWDMINYRGSVEFYNDFANYDVTINVPNDWMVWATGIWQNPETTLQKEVLIRYQTAQQTESVINIISTDNHIQKNVFRKDAKGDFHYKAKNVPDFAFAVAKGFSWDGCSVKVSEEETVFVDAVYAPKSISGPMVAEYAKSSVHYMSYELPGLSFPYPKITTYLNGTPKGGMEFPMMTNNGDSPNAVDAFVVTFHEICHTYTPFFMGTNEKKYAWMDEGFAELFPSVMTDSLFKGNNYLLDVIKSYEKSCGTDLDLPLMVPSYLEAADYKAYRLSAYIKPAVALVYLQDALGSERFRLALQYYMITWKGKHPLPLDFFNCMSVAANEDLSWYIKPWFCDWAYPDLAVSKLTNDNNVVVENVGGLPLPITLKVEYKNGISAIYNKDTSIWKYDSKTVVLVLPENGEIKSVEIICDYIPDINHLNNRLEK
jgi:Aminopeptidase N